MRIRRDTGETPLTKDQIRQAEIAQQRYINSTKHMNIPPSPTVPINLTPNWANQSNAQYQQSRQERALQSF